MSNETGQRSTYELWETWQEDPSAWRDEVEIVNPASRRTVDRFPAAGGLEDAETTVATLVGRGDWLIRLIKRRGGFGPQAMVRTERDLRPEPTPEAASLPTANPFEPSAGQFNNPFAMFAQQQAIDLARRDRDEAERRARNAEQQLAQSQSELASVRAQLVDGEQRGYRRGFEEGEAHGRRIAGELSKAKAGEGFAGDLAETAKAIAGAFASAKALPPATPNLSPPSPTTVGGKVEQVVRTSVALGTSYDAAAHQIADVLELSQPSDLLRADVREHLAAELSADPSFVAYVAGDPAAASYVRGFNEWLAAFDVDETEGAAEPEVLDGAPEDAAA